VIDHVSVTVSDLKASKAFYAAALQPLGYKVLMEYPGSAGLGADGKPDLWLVEGKPGTPVHVAVAAKDPGSIAALHQAALKAGGKDNGKPGPRPEYHPGYHGAFVLDPDGHNVEAVSHR
jgi:catechol 2,3-dioxygenase-like lactoylglutathione lyase family enzyme